MPHTQRAATRTKAPIEKAKRETRKIVLCMAFASLQRAMPSPRPPGYYQDANVGSPLSHAAILIDNAANDTSEQVGVSMRYNIPSCV
jgi:hypothetical protein